MKIRYNVSGTERKRLVQTIGQFLEVKPKYLGMPSMAYEIDIYTVDRDGTLSFSDRTDSEEVEGLLEAISAAGFEFEPVEDDSVEEPTAAAQARTDGLRSQCRERFSRTRQSRTCISWSTAKPVL